MAWERMYAPKKKGRVRDEKSSDFQQGTAGQTSMEDFI